MLLKKIKLFFSFFLIDTFESILWKFLVYCSSTSSFLAPVVITISYLSSKKFEILFKNTFISFELGFISVKSL